ncbi:HAD family hydrolase [Paenibacillus tarimensis]
MAKILLFDLDNTLIWDEQSMREAFEAACMHAARCTAVEHAKLEKYVREEADRLFRGLETYSYADAIELTCLEALWSQFRKDLHPMLRRLGQIAPAYRKAAWTAGLQRAGVDNEDLGAALAEMFMVERRKRPLLYEDTLRTLNQLVQDYRMLILTNGDPDLQQEKVDGIAGLADFFEHIVISGCFEEGKPGGAMFRHSLSLAGACPEECIMIGDNLLTDILGANRAGIPSIWVNRSGKARSSAIAPDREVTSLSEIPGLLRSLTF